MNGHPIQMNGHWNQKQIGQNNHLHTLFYNHFYILSNCNWFWWNVIEFSGIVIEFSGIVIEFSGIVIEYRAIWSKQSPPNTTITSKHYFTIISIFGQIATDFDEWSSKTYQIGRNNHLQTLYHTLQAKPSQECKRMWERKKDGLALSSHFSGSSQVCVSSLVSVKISMKL